MKLNKLIPAFDASILSQFNMGTFMSALGLNSTDIGTKPQVADPIDINTAASTDTALTNVTNSMGRLTQISDSINTANQTELNQMQEMAAPGVTAMKGNTVKAIDTMLTGGLPQDVINNIMQTSAETSGTAGIGGSAMAESAAKYQVGLASLENIDKAISASSQFLSSLKTAPMFDPATLMITPAQQVAVDTENATNKQQQQQYQYNVNAAPTPMAAYGMSMGAQMMGAVMAQALQTSQYQLSHPAASAPWGNPSASSYGSQFMGANGMGY